MLIQLYEHVQDITVLWL